jgi:hypothetical protein
MGEKQVNHVGKIVSERFAGPDCWYVIYLNLAK